MTTTIRDPKYGLCWRSSFVGEYPGWSVEPDENEIKNLVHRVLFPDQAEVVCKISFFAEGTFNKLYRIDVPGHTHLIRISLPVEPRVKTAGEVATIEQVRGLSDVPVPNIRAFSMSNDNEIGFEWMLTDLIPGSPLSICWRKLNMNQKEAITKTIARFMAEIFRKKWSEIGSLGSCPSNSNDTHSFLSTTFSIRGTSDIQSDSDTSIETETDTVLKQDQVHVNNLTLRLGTLLSVDYIGENASKTHQGPFKTDYDWQYGRVRKMMEEEVDVLYQRGDDNDEEEQVDGGKDEEADQEELDVAKNRLEVFLDLLAILPRVFPVEPVVSCLSHSDMGLQNILADKDGQITGIIDWEFVSVLPLWTACQFPKFLTGRKRSHEPKREQYAKGEESEHKTDELQPGMEPDAEGMPYIYWQHFMEFEQTHLRGIFLSEMRKIEPEWVEIYEASKLKVAVAQMIDSADWVPGLVKRWVKAFQEGTTLDWDAMRDPGQKYIE